MSWLGRRAWPTAVAFCALATGACSELSRDIALGTAIPAGRDLSTCTARGCGAAAAESKPLDEGPVYPCTPSAAGVLHVAWEALRRDERGPTPAPNVDCGVRNCTATATGMVVASDRTLWVAATLTAEDADGSYQEPIGVWLGQYAWEGALLGSRVLVMESLALGEGVNFGVTLAAGRDGHVFVALGEQLRREGFFDPQESLFVQEYASGVVPVGERFTLENNRRPTFVAPLLESAGGGAVVIALGTRLALMDADRRFVWVQQAPRVDLIVGDVQQHVTVYSSDVSAGGDQGSLYHYDPQGRLLWQRSLEGTSELSLEVDGRGNLIRTGPTQPLTLPFVGEPSPRELGVQKISPEGESIWNVRFTDSGMIFNSPITGRAAAVEADGRVWLLGAQEELALEQPISRQHLYQVPATGDACLDYVVESQFFSITAIAAIPGGDGVYVFAQDGIGRIAL